MRNARRSHDDLNTASNRRWPPVAVLLAFLAASLAVPSATLAMVNTGFIENHGQVNEAVRYYRPGSNASVYFTPDAIVIDLKKEIARVPGSQTEPLSQERLRDGGPGARPPEDVTRRSCAVWISFEGANPSPSVEARGKLLTKFNYFVGSDPEHWHAGIRAYAEVVYRDLWPVLV